MGRGKKGAWGMYAVACTGLWLLLHSVTYRMWGGKVLITLYLVRMIIMLMFAPRGHSGEMKLIDQKRIKMCLFSASIYYYLFVLL